ncbi:J domain-containing protein [Noviherbaspirillum aridicola]|uniref:J domain-containing protein n=1 Tax=Noviherbaspirillum aridicola TaxID=2849687 RepID=A0ABQ4QA09_9BURK|nr:J domain-containing protein [Noviherbaspirillum aridicola]GIZ53889.1 hypothetical protein NCCP691_39030 [Noviherbaspirillum aridicola]
MAHVHTHYDNLKVARDAPPEVIRAAYKTLCQKYHPDRHGDSAEAIRVIQIINTAYSVLSDPAKRKEHDEWIARAEAAPPEKPRDAPRAEAAESRHARRHSHRSHRRSALDLLYSRHRPSHQLARAVHRALVSLEEFTKKLFRRA